MSELQAIFARRRRLLEEAENREDDNEEHPQKKLHLATDIITRDETSPDTVIQDDISLAPSASNTEEEGHTHNLLVSSCSEKDDTSPQPNNKMKVRHDDTTTSTTVDTNDKLDNKEVRLIMEKGASERAEYASKLQEEGRSKNNVISVNVDNGLSDTDVVKEEEDTNADNVDTPVTNGEEEEAVPADVSRVILQPSNKDPVGKDSSRKQ